MSTEKRLRDMVAMLPPIFGGHAGSAHGLATREAQVVPMSSSIVFGKQYETQETQQEVADSDVNSIDSTESNGSGSDSDNDSDGAYEEANETAEIFRDMAQRDILHCGKRKLATAHVTMMESEHSGGSSSRTSISITNLSKKLSLKRNYSLPEQFNKFSDKLKPKNRNKNRNRSVSTGSGSLFGSNSLNTSAVSASHYTHTYGQNDHRDILKDLNLNLHLLDLDDRSEMRAKTPDIDFSMDVVAAPPPDIADEYFHHRKHTHAYRGLAPSSSSSLPMPPSLSPAPAPAPTTAPSLSMPAGWHLNGGVLQE
jgi:hypothetical protein